jgi:hypothetical protein
MIDHSLRVAICHSITARAHLAGAEAAELEAQAMSLQPVSDNAWHQHGRLIAESLSARRRYWREQEACELLHGRRWPEAEALGAEQ